ncbi:MAG TPA: serine hydrolase domain-containing protein [Mucilaginibacter sp.]|jgi:CubicO group peptidase (beta-lactamase class C family)|nr:serine hydrolase domain-containing protein [Mucilaginibacter sp.]
MPSIRLKKLLKYIAITFPISFLWINVFGQSKFEKLDSNLEQLFSKDSLPGLSVMLVNSKGVIYKKSLGFADNENKKPYTFNTIQNIGSVSKTFIAVALMKAIELNYFTLETDINDLLPFKVVNPNHPGDKITIRELANHTSGIIDNPGIYPNSYKFYPEVRDYSKNAFDAAKSIGYQQKVNDTSLAQFFYNYLAENGKYYSKNNFGKGLAGSTSSYSNIASALAAYLIEIKSGISYAEFTSKYILKPLKMDNSGWFISSVDLKKHAKLYYTNTAYFPLYNLLTYPDGGLKTSANDLSKYLISIIRGYNGDNAILKPTSYKLMFTPQFSEQSPPKDINLSKRNKGIFWNLYTNGTIGHDGDDPGISTFLFFNTKTGMGGLFLCNKYLPDKQPIIDLLVNATN